MKTILVTTDLSTYSKAALRFAIQLAIQGDYKLTFFHSYEVLRPSSWNDQVFQSFEKNESAKVTRKLHKFVCDVYKSLDVTNEDPKCVAKSGVYADRNIMDYASKNKYDFICISRKGGGKTARLFGSNISRLITRSIIPVIAVPGNYRRKPISRITFASDLSNLDHELKKVTSFSQPLDATVELLHFKVAIDYISQGTELNAIRRKLEPYQIAAHYEIFDYEHPLIENINKVIKRSKPSMLIMFTDQNRDLFEKIFMSSISAEFSLISKVPLLVFSKRQRKS
jgi:nucleotide-binding universal stress UspA family protein